MAPQVTAWEDLAFFHEEVDKVTGEFQYTAFAVFDEDDIAYFGKSNHPKGNINLKQLTSALAPIPDDDVFPEWMPSDVELTRAQNTPLPNIFIKRPNLPLYDIFQEHNLLDLIPIGFLEEAKAMEMLFNPTNILVDDEGMPVLIDFGSAREIGAKLGTSCGTKGLIDEEMKDYHTSEKTP